MGHINLAPHMQTEMLAPDLRQQVDYFDNVSKDTGTTVFDRGAMKTIAEKIASQDGGLSVDDQLAYAACYALGDSPSEDRPDKLKLLLAATMVSLDRAHVEAGQLLAEVLDRPAAPPASAPIPASAPVDDKFATQARDAMKALSILRERFINASSLYDAADATREVNQRLSMQTRKEANRILLTTMDWFIRISGGYPRRKSAPTPPAEVQ